MHGADKAFISATRKGPTGLVRTASGKWRSVPEQKIAKALMIMDHDLQLEEDGGKGSGNFGHKGRPGQRGGSGPGGHGVGNLVPKKPAKPAKSRRISATRFVPTLQAAKDTCPERSRWRVDTTRSPKDFTREGIKVFTTAGGSTFALKPDGDIISVCKNQTGDQAMNARDLMAAAVARGGTHLDSYDGNYYFYAKCGFEVVSRCKFDPKYAPDGWDESKGDRREDVVFMRYVGVGNVRDQSKEAMRKRVPYSEDYDAAEAACKAAVREG